MFDTPIERVGIIGLGQIGGSIALDLSKDFQVCFYARNPSTREVGRSRGLRSCGTIGEVVRSSDVIFVCVPVDQAVGVMDEALPLLSDSQILTDVGSTKSGLMNWISGLPREKVAPFVGGHPMAGSTVAGFAGAQTQLFSGATWILTPDTRAEGALDALLPLVTLITDNLQAKVAVMDWDAHDRAAAIASHLEHLIALALVEMVRGSSDALRSLFLAGSFKSATRVAASDPEMVTPFLMASKYLGDSVSEFQEVLSGFAEQLKGGGNEIDVIWRQAAIWRKALDSKASRLEKVVIPRDSNSIGALEALARESKLITRLQSNAQYLTLEIEALDFELD